MVKISLLALAILLASFTKPSGEETTPIENVNNLTSADIHFNLIVNNVDNIHPLPESNVLNLGIIGYMRLLEEGKIEKGKPLTVIDFSLPSTEKRIWVIDIKNGMILHHDLVSHGRNSGNLMAEKFSNVNSSFMSSLGFYLTGETYFGKHGYSLRLDGLEETFNGNARERAIVIHGADYAEENFAKQTGRLGRSLGCLALPNQSAPVVIDLIKDQSCIFIYGNNIEYLTQSRFLNS